MESAVAVAAPDAAAALKLCNENKTVNLLNSFIPKTRIVPSQYDNVELYFSKKENALPVHLLRQVLYRFHRF